MSALTLDEKANYAALRAREQEAEKHFYDLNQPHHPLGFRVVYRNPGHWDIIAERAHGRPAAHQHVHPNGFTSERDPQGERAFRIRGEPGDVRVYDERWNPHRVPEAQGGLRFRSVMGAMLWTAEELMQEPPHD